MNKRLLGTIGSVLVGASALVAMDSSARPIKIEPAPKEVQLRDGGFQSVLTPKFLFSSGTSRKIALPPRLSRKKWKISLDSGSTSSA